MARLPSPLHRKSVPKRVSKPTATAEAAATVAESAVAPPAPRRARAAKAAPAAKKAPPANQGARSPAKARPVPATKAKAESGAKAKTSAEATADPASAPARPAKAHKAKLVRDSFTIPKDEYAVLAALKARALALGQRARKSELLRAGIQVLAGMDDGAFLAAVGAVPTLKTGRPKKG